MLGMNRSLKFWLALALIGWLAGPAFAGCPCCLHEAAGGLRTHSQATRETAKARLDTQQKHKKSDDDACVCLPPAKPAGMASAAGRIAANIANTLEGAALLRSAIKLRFTAFTPKSPPLTAAVSLRI